MLVARQPGRAVVCALGALLANDSLLLSLDANERSITFRLAMYLQQQLPDLTVDCEYNRDGHDPKRISLTSPNPGADDCEARTVFPDIVAHVRNTEENYLVIELKKSTSSSKRAFDLEKLRGYKRALSYKFALFIELSVGENPDVSLALWID